MIIDTQQFWIQAKRLFSTHMINTYELATCRLCGSENIVKDGFSETRIRRYGCKECGRRFTVITNTIFDGRKLPVSEWVCFLLDLFGYSSFSLTSKVNINAVSTTKYWVRKLFLLLDGIQDDIMLGGKVWIDETFIKVRKSDIEKRPDGGLSSRSGYALFKKGGCNKYVRGGDGNKITRIVW